MTNAHRHHSALTLIPFGLRTADRRLVDVSQVPKGAGCGCICPSCRAPLIARQGEVKEWHFAHASRGLGRGSIRRCEYSFYLSVAQMAKQLFMDCPGLRLPDYLHRETIHGRWSHRSYVETITLTRGSRVAPDRCRPDKQLAGHGVDVLCEVRGVSLGIVLERPDKPCRLRGEQFAGQKAGVLKIDLLETLRIFRGLHRTHREVGFHRALARFLFERSDHKHWLYHPRQESGIRALKERLQARVEREEAPYRDRELAARAARRAAELAAEGPEPPSPAPLVPASVPAEPKPVSPTPPPPPRPPRSKPTPQTPHPVRYACVVCEYVWTGDRNGLNPCPKCGKHLYRRALDEEPR